MIKLIIWDLDGILWDGTLAEEGISKLNQKVIDFIKQTESQGIIHSICSKNEFDSTKNKLVELGLWDLFVFPSIDFTIKYPRVESIIENCQLQKQHILFVDDSITNTQEVKYYIPEINVTNTIDFIDTFEYVSAKNRTNQYRILEKKFADKDNINFLYDSNIHICITNAHGCILFHDRIVDLVNRSNTLNFTKSRMNVDFSESNITPYFHFNTPRENYAVFVWDKYGYYGLVGYFSSWDCIVTEHFVFSCRIMNMGIENYCAKFIQEKLGWKMNFEIDTSKNYDYIHVNDYNLVKSFLEEKESVKLISEKPLANINAGCMSYIFWALSGISQKLTYETYTLEKIIENNYIKTWPNLIVFSVSGELEMANFPAKNYEHIINCVDIFRDQVISQNKKVLLIIPLDFHEVVRRWVLDPFLITLYEKFLSIIDNNNFIPFYLHHSHNYQYRHWNRETVYAISQKIKNWVENPLHYNEIKL